MMESGSTYYIVTGASKGLGREMVKQLIEEDSNKVLAVSRSHNLLKELFEKSGKKNLEILPVDLSVKEERRKLSEWIEGKWPRVDVLINNAGHLVNKPFRAMTEEDFDQTITVNYKAPYFLTQDLLPHLTKSERGSVLNIGSMGGIPAVSKFPGLSVYSSSKGALSILTECLAEELKEFNISVNCFCLGSVQTEMLNEAFPGYDAQSSPEQMATAILGIHRSTHRVMNGKIIPLAGTDV